MRNPLTLRGSEPGGVARPVGQEEKGHGAQQDCRNSFQKAQQDQVFAMMHGQLREGGIVLALPSAVRYWWVNQNQGTMRADDLHDRAAVDGVVSGLRRL